VVIVKKLQYMENGKYKKFEDNESNNITFRFEEMLRNNQSLYFDVDEIEEIAELYLENNNYDKAVQVIDYGLKLHNFASSLSLKKARAFYMKNQPEMALKIMHQLTYIEKSADYYYLLASIYALLGDKNKAIKLFEKVLKDLDHTKQDLFHGIAIAFMQANFFDAAVQFLEKANNHFPDDLSITYDLAYSYEKNGSNEKSIALYEKYLENNPFSASAWHNLGYTYGRIRNADKAIEAYEFAIAINPKFSTSYFNLANYYANLRKYDKAIDLYHEHLQLESDNIIAICYIAECYDKMQYFGRAHFYYEKALSKDPKFAEAWFGLGILFMKQGDNKKAIAEIKKAIENDEKNSEYWLVLGNCYTRSKNYTQAIDTYQKAASLDPHDHDVWLNYAALIFRKKKAEAIKILNQGYAHNPNNAEINYRLAAYNFLQKDINQTVKFLENALAINYNLLDTFFDYCPKAKSNKIIRTLIDKADSKNN